jgi:hypothetical protein
MKISRHSPFEMKNIFGDYFARLKIDWSENVVEVVYLLMQVNWKRTSLSNCIRLWRIPSSTWTGTQH